MGLPSLLMKIGADGTEAIRGMNNVVGHADKTLGPRGKLTSLAKSGAKAAAAGVAAAFALAVAAGAEGISSAIEDQASQGKLAATMRDTTKATDEQIAAMEDYIGVAQRRTGLDDGDMRTGLSRLLRSTKDVTRAQAIMNTAIKIHLATGKPLVGIVEALAKANDGNVNALKKAVGTVGPAAKAYGEYQKNVLATAKAERDARDARDRYGASSKEYAKALDKVRSAKAKLDGGKQKTRWLAELNKQFASAEAEDAKTYAGGVRRVSTAWGELLESFGSGVLDDLGSANDGMGDFADVLYDAQDPAAALGGLVGGLATSLADTSKYLGPVVDKLNELNSMGDGIITNGTLSTVFGKIVPGVQFIAGKLTGNEQAATEANVLYAGGSVSHRDPSQPSRTDARPVQTLGQSLVGSVDPTRYVRRAQNADSRAAARSARSRARP